MFTSEGAIVGELKGHAKSVNSVSFTADGDILTGSWDGYGAAVALGCHGDDVLALNAVAVRVHPSARSRFGGKVFASTPSTVPLVPQRPPQRCSHCLLERLSRAAPPPSSSIEER